MRKYIVSIITLFIIIPLSVVQAQQKVVTIDPPAPERGQKVTIVYHTKAKGAKISPDADKVQLVFTYSTLYELPYQIDMQKRGSDWYTSFTLPRYATYATFYFKSGDITDKPSGNRHYALAVYQQNKQRVKNGFLYEAYSLPAQMGHSDSLGIKQRQLYTEELKNFPGNYEAGLRLLKYDINHASGRDKEALIKKAHELIAQKFREAPTVMNNLNQVTMGYLILGEKSRLDSVRQVVMDQYPHSGAAKEFLTSVAARVKDTARKIAMLEDALKDETKKDEDSYTGIHEMLFDYYAGRHNAEKALYHARMMAAVKNPYRPATLKSIAEKLTLDSLALDTALSYADEALQLAGKYPAGIIRYFPEFGYIPSYTDDSTRKAVTGEVRGNLISLKGIIQAKLGRPQQAQQEAALAAGISDDNQTLHNIARINEMTGRPGDAVKAYKKMLLHAPSDSIALAALKKNYLRYHGSHEGLDKIMAEIDAAWKKKMTEKLDKQRLNKKLPGIAGLVDLTGKPVDKEMLKNKVVVMDFWATWCVPCMHELPYIQKVYDQYKDNPDVVFMVINSGANNTLEDAQKWKKRQSYTFPVYYTNDPHIGEKLEFSVIPALFVIDKTGYIQFKTIGFEGPDTAPKLALEIEMMLENKGENNK